MSMQQDPILDPAVTPQAPAQDPASFAAGTADAPGAPPQAPATITVEVPATGNQPDPERRFTAEDIERARQEEKQKLYGRLETNEQRLARLEAEREAERAAVAEQQRQAEEAARAAAEAEMDAKTLLEARTQEWDQRFNQMEEERKAERAAAQKEQEFLHLQNYITQVQAQVQENVLPELLDLIGVGCETREQVDASVSTVLQRSASILQNVTSVGGGAPAPQPPRGPSITAPPVGPADTQSGTRSYTAEEIKAMPMGEYQKIRDSLLGSASRQVSERGLYG